MTLSFRMTGMSALLAAVGMAASPAAAAEFPLHASTVAVPTPGSWDATSVDTANHRYYRYRRHRGFDAGDVIAGVVILGGIAAIASAASRNARDRDYNYPDRDYRYRNGDYRNRPYQYRPYRGDSRYMDTRGINNAIDICVRAVERDVRVESVDSVDRLADGWRVEGSVYDGEGFSCRIGNDGRVDAVDFGARRWNGTGVNGEIDRQWDSEAYEQAWRSHDARPAYPGGPIEGENN